MSQWSENDLAAHKARNPKAYARGMSALAKLVATPGAVAAFNALTGEEAKALVRKGRIRNVAAKDQRTYAGRVYHSKAEAEYAAKLDLLIKAGTVTSWTPQVPIRLLVNGQYITKLIVDFQVNYRDGSTELIEIKGMESEAWKVRRKLFRALYPGLTYRVEKVA